MIEIWKDILGYEGLYQVSNLGRVKSLNYHKTRKEHILKPTNCHGYLRVNLSKNKNRKSYLVHRLVGEAFISNFDNLPEINHKDENKHNNCVENLEWCDRQYNNTYGTMLQKNRDSHNPKPVKCLDLETNKILFFHSQNEAAKYFNTYNYVISYSIYKSKQAYKNRYIFSEN